MAIVFIGKNKSYWFLVSQTVLHLNYIGLASLYWHVCFKLLAGKYSDFNSKYIFHGNELPLMLVNHAGSFARKPSHPLMHGSWLFFYWYIHILASSELLYVRLK